MAWYDPLGQSFNNMLGWGNAPQQVVQPMVTAAGLMQGYGGNSFSLSPALGSGGLGGGGGWQPGLLDKLTGYRDPSNGIQVNGLGSLALGAAQGLGGAFLAMKQYGLAQDALKEQQRQFNLNYQSQRTLINSQLRDRQAARVASNPGAYQSVSDYIKQNGV